MKNRSFWKAFSYAFEGITQTIKQERNFRFHLAAAGYVLYFARFYSLSPSAWGALLCVIGCILAGELFNTAIEQTVNLVGRERTPEGKLAKDAAAGAVLLLAFASVLIGIIFFWNPSIFKDIIKYHIKRPLFGILLLLSGAVAYCFVFKWDLFYKGDKGD